MNDKKSFFQRKKKAVIIVGAALVLALILIFNLSANREPPLKPDAAQYKPIPDRDRAMIRFYKTELEGSKARLQKDKDYYDSQQKLYSESLISKEQLEQASLQFDMSSAGFQSTQHQIEQSEAALRSTRDTLGKTSFSSPIDGIITTL